MTTQVGATAAARRPLCAPKKCLYMAMLLSLTASVSTNATTDKTLTAKELMSTPPDGYQLARMKRYSEARQWAQKRIAKDRGDIDSWYLKAYMEDVLHHNQLAETTTKLIAMKKYIGFAHRLRANAYFDMGKPDKSLDDINKAIRLIPNSSGLYALRSRLYAGFGRTREAEQDHRIQVLYHQLYISWEKVVEAEAQRPSLARKSTFQQEYAAGQKAFGRLAFQAAADYFTRVIEVKPDCLEAYLYRAESLEGMDNWSDALKDLSHLVALGPDKKIPIRVPPDDVRKVPFDKWTKIELPMSEVYLRRARCYASLKKHSLAVEDLNIAVKQEPEDRWTSESRGNANCGLKNYKQAIADYTRAEHLQPTYLNCQSKLIECYMNVGDYKNAIVRLSWHLKYSPNDDAMLLERSSALAHLGFHKEAIDDLNAVLDLDPDYIEAYIRRAKEYESLGNLQKALKDYKSALGVDGENRKAREGLERVTRQLNQSNQSKKPT